MMTPEFYRTEPNPRTSWRLAILTGSNTRTYKFALGSVLLELAAQGRTEVPLDELAALYAMAIVAHQADAPQASTKTPWRDTDFLVVAEREAAESKALGRPTERLLNATMDSIPAMVMERFHNLKGKTRTAHTFYESTGKSRARIVRLTPDLLRIAQSEQAQGLRAELAARWDIVALSFAAGIGPSLVNEGFAVDWETQTLMDTGRRRSVTGVADALIGFQHGRCLICTEPITPADQTAVDHVFPYSLMRRLGVVSGWRGPDLDAVWNLAPTHRQCNADKSDRPPTSGHLHRLARRNEAIMHSPHPLKRTLLLSLNAARLRRETAEQWPYFLRQVQAACD
ncbi:HNH endonuclease [Embleya sp. NPDC020886]|uniref:HNH endonuclease n=1 Tax=Embleya sp. NPDC020886 TaxID=3363980 RepID=UPI0037B24264